MKTLNAAACNLVARFARLRTAALAFNLEIGAEFAIQGSDGWKRHGLRGLAAACWSLAAMLADVPGSADLYLETKRLGSAILAA